MRPLPNRYKGALAVALAAVLGASSAQAADSNYIQTINNILGNPPTVDSAPASAVVAATLTVISQDTSHAENYVHDVLAKRNDRNTIAVKLVSGALVSGSATVNADAEKAGSIVGMATTSDLQSLGLLPATIEKIATAAVKKMPLSAQVDTANSVGKSVGANLTGDLITTFAKDVILTMPSLAAQGRFAGGVSASLTGTSWIAYTKALDTKSPKAIGEICYGVIAQSGTANFASRVAASESAVQTVAAGLTSAQKGLVAQGFVKASGAAHTANIITNVLAADPNTKNQVLFSNLSAFTTSVASAVSSGLPMDQAEGIMRIITNTLASGTYTKVIGQLPVTLGPTEKALIGAAAVKVAPVSLAGADKTINPPNPANAAVQGILATGGIVDKTAFAIAVAKGAANYENAGQVVNAVATSLGANLSGTTAPSEYVDLSKAVIKALPKATAAITQRVAQLIPPTTGQAARVNLAIQLANQFPASANLIAVGVSNTDPQFAEVVTSAVLSNGSIAIRNNAAKIAGAVASTIPAEYASEVSEATGALIGTGTGAVLKLSQASAIAKAIASAPSVKNNQEELQVVAAQMIGQLMYLYTTVVDPQGTIRKTIVSTVATVAKTVSQVAFASNSLKFNPNAAQSTRYVNDIAGSCAQMVANKLGYSNPDLNTIVTAISLAVQSVTPAAGDDAVKTAIYNVLNQQGTPYATDNHYINDQETPVTNF